MSEDNLNRLMKCFLLFEMHLEQNPAEMPASLLDCSDNPNHEFGNCDGETFAYGEAQSGVASDQESA